MRQNNKRGIDKDVARLFGGILAFVVTANLALRLWEWRSEGHFSCRGVALPVGAFVLALAHLLAPGNRRVYQVATVLFIIVLIADLLIDAIPALHR